MIKARIDLVDYIGRLVLLRRRGGRHWGLCPFHAEKTPSFSVHDRGFFKCFGCGVGGDLIAFVRRLEELSFAEACDKLARNWGIVDFVPTAEDRDRRRRRQAELDRRDEAGEIDRARGALEIWRGAARARGDGRRGLPRGPGDPMRTASGRRMAADVAVSRARQIHARRRSGVG